MSDTIALSLFAAVALVFIHFNLENVYRAEDEVEKEKKEEEEG